MDPLLSHLIVWPVAGVLLAAGWLLNRHGDRLRERDELEARIRAIPSRLPLAADRDYIHTDNLDRLSVGSKEQTR